MEQIEFDEEVVKEKAEFIKNNAVKLYFLRKDKYGTDMTVEERLISILLSDKPLLKCRHYNILFGIIEAADENDFIKEEYQNYSLKTLFSATKYINDFTKKDETGMMLRDRMRRYSKYLDSYLIGEDEIHMDITPEQRKMSMEKVKLKIK